MTPAASSSPSTSESCRHGNLAGESSKVADTLGRAAHAGAPTADAECRYQPPRSQNRPTGNRVAACCGTMRPSPIRSCSQKRRTRLRWPAFQFQCPGYAPIDGSLPRLDSNRGVRGEQRRYPPQRPVPTVRPSFLECQVDQNRYRSGPARRRPAKPQPRAEVH